MNLPFRLYGNIVNFQLVKRQGFLASLEMTSKRDFIPIRQNRDANKFKKESTTSKAGSFLKTHDGVNLCSVLVPLN